MHKRCDFLRAFCFVLFLLLCVNLGYAKLEIIVKSSPDWGEISDADVKKLCQNIADHFEEHLRPENEINDSVNVYRTFRQMSYVTLDQSHDVKYKIGIVLKKDMEIRVDDFYYFIRDFSHEFCHILQNFEVIYPDNPNIWFQESIALMASIWALRDMAKTWKNNSPFGQSVIHDDGIAYYFSHNFNYYANIYLNVIPSTQYTGTGKEWLEQNEMSLREKHYRNEPFLDYDLVSQLSFMFLPIFEEHPEAWNAVRKMPASKSKMSEYMQDWYDAVDVQDQQYVEAIAKEMGITVTSPVASIDADVNDDGYVDLYDVMIVRSGMSNSMSYDTDINKDGVTDDVDLHIVKSIAMQAIAAAAPRKRKVNITTWGILKTH